MEKIIITVLKKHYISLLEAKIKTINESNANYIERMNEIFKN